MKTIKRFIMVLGIVLGMGLVMPAGAYAANAIDAQCSGVTGSAICQQNTSSNNLIQNIVNTLLFIVGALSVVMIIIGGIMYATSAGDSGRVTKAKNTVMYAVLGLVVAFLAFAIVQFVATQVIKKV